MKLSPIARDNLRSAICGMDEEEKRLALHFFPTQQLQDELVRRTESTEKVLNDVFNALSVVTDEMTLIEMQNVLKDLKLALSK